MDQRKRVRRGESFGRTGVDRSLSNSLKCPSRQKQRCTTASSNPVMSTTTHEQCDSMTTAITNDTTESIAPRSSRSRSVRFAEETPLMYLCSNFDKNCSPEDYEKRKKELWYSREDFEDFLRDRISTIRLLQVVQGDSIALRQYCPDVCLRGLEPYQQNSVNQELQCQRQWHQRVVLAEQSLQKRNKQDSPERLRALAEERSDWARQRARQLANLDELEVQLADAEPQMRRRSLATAQLGMENLMLTQQRKHQHQRRRASTIGIATAASNNLLNNNNNTSSSSSSLPSLGLSSRRVPVDLAILKEWNAKFLHDMRQKGGVPSSTTPNTSPTLPISSSSSTTITTATPSSVTSLSEKTAQSRLALQRQRQSLLGSSAGNTAMSFHNHNCGSDLLASKDADGAPSFRFALRRDSLVGLRRESLIAARAAAAAAAADPATSTSNSSGGASMPSHMNPAMMAVTAGNPASSAATTLTDACFRFPVRRDSLSSVHW